ncbi:MAG: hypothetical protein N4A38_03215 [Candidatus Gracilibacteria bacterium]|nr:hypothetical protein [Candidatus Gracilibacteria bacterium]
MMLDYPEELSHTRDISKKLRDITKSREALVKFIVDNKIYKTDEEKEEGKRVMKEWDETERELREYAELSENFDNLSDKEKSRMWDLSGKYKKIIDAVFDELGLNGNDSLKQIYCDLEGGTKEEEPSKDSDDILDGVDLKLRGDVDELLKGTPIEEEKTT